MDHDVFFFEPRTGIVKNSPFCSNFYIYRLPKSCLAKVEMTVANANLEYSGFVYDKEFVIFLNKYDTKWDQRTGLPASFYTCE